MSGTTTMNLLQSINATFAGIRTAPQVSAYPTALNTAALPMALTWPSDATWQRKGGFGALNREDRTYRILVFVEPLGQSDIPTRIGVAATLMATMIEGYLFRTTSRIGLALPDSPTEGTHQIVIAEGPHSDGGLVSNLQFGQVAYHGFELRVRVRELW